MAAPAPAATGEEISRELRAGRAVVLSEVTVSGPVDLERTDLVRAIFKCRGCVFTGDFSAPDVTFERTVDLSGSRFEADVDFRGATFRAPALFRVMSGDQDGIGEHGDSKELATTFEQSADFSLAVFEDLASFAGSNFVAGARFRDTRFGDATFSSVRIAQNADFKRASFRGGVTFNDAAFSGETTFREADFRRWVDFSQATFKMGGDFTRTQFADDVSFLDARFELSQESAEAARFQNVAVAGNLDFTFATFDLAEGATPRDRSQVIAVFWNLVCGQSLTFRDTVFAEEQRITMTRLQVRDLFLDIDLVPQIDDEADQRDVLEIVEEKAKARGDLGDANDAHFELRVLRSEDYGALVHALDYVFYRGIAGYFVRPAQPILILLALAMSFSLIRFARVPAPSSEEGSASRLRRLGRRAGHRCVDLLTCTLDTFARIGPRGRGSSGAPTPVAERLEVLAYRLLLACVLLGLANSNPTLREMVDTLV